MAPSKDYLERMRKRQALTLPTEVILPEVKPQQPIARPFQKTPAPPPKPGGRPNKQKPPVVGTEPVTAQCGHVIPFELFADKADKFRARRREKAQGQPCSNCRKKKHEEKQKKQQEEAKERKRLKRAAGKAVPKWRRDAAYRLERLPHGSSYQHLSYSENGEEKKWSGVLVIPVDGGIQTFQGESTAVFKLLSYLDLCYRKWLAKEGKEDPAAKTEEVKEETPATVEMGKEGLLENT